MRRVVTFGLVALLASCSRPEARPDTVASVTPTVAPSALAPSASENVASLPSAPVDAGPPEVRAWFSLTPKKCGADKPTYGKCYVVTLSLYGSVERDIVVAKDQWGQDSCRVLQGKSVLCEGASGATSIDLACANSGSCDIRAVSNSDGYCPPPEDCSTRMKLASFTIPASATLTYAKP